MQGYRRLGSGGHCEIWAAPSIPESIATADDEDRARAKTILKHIMEKGHDGLPKTQFPLEGRFSSGVAGVPEQAVYAVKAYNVRVYGGYVGSKPRRFVCVEGAIKKRNPANQSQLKRIAKVLGALNNEYE
jgi:hypothetical protein